MNLVCSFLKYIVHLTGFSPTESNGWWAIVLPAASKTEEDIFSSIENDVFQIAGSGKGASGIKEITSRCHDLGFETTMKCRFNYDLCEVFFYGFPL